MSTVLTERQDRVLLITLNRPDALNAVNTELANDLMNAIRLLDQDPELTVGILAGAGRGFCSGMDLKAFAAEGPPVGFDQFLRDGSTKPLIAAIEGFALAGGLEIALTCDLLVAARGAMFGIPEARVGLFAAGGALFRLPNRVPFGVAMELALTADSISAEKAAEYGMVSRVAEPGSAVDDAFELAGRIAKNGPLGVRASKQLIRRSVGISEDEAWILQNDYASAVFESEDAKEGPRAFAEKRPPVWAGR